jgi:hypothetical protein
MNDKTDARRAGAVGNMMPRLAACALVLAIVAASGAAAQDQAVNDQPAKTPAAKSQAGQQGPEPVLTVAAKEMFAGESVPDLQKLAWDELNYYLAASNPLKRQRALAPLAVLPMIRKRLSLVTKMLAAPSQGPPPKPG